jgi:tetratricopeptide (TPR) repeat protein
MGQYLLAQWHESAPRFFAGGPGTADSAREIFRTWLRLQPRNPVALDSLASGFAAEERWDSAAVYYRRLLEYHPHGYPYGAYRLAWALFRDGRHAELEPWLRRCDVFGEEARYQLMQAASDWQRGRRRRARAALEKSLKLDKTMAETHAFLRQTAQGDSAAAELHGRWQERTGP